MTSPSGPSLCCVNETRPCPWCGFDEIYVPKPPPLRTESPVLCQGCYRLVPLYHVSIDGEPTGDGGVYSALWCRRCIDRGVPD